MLWQARGEDRRIAAESDKRWLESTELLSRRIEEASSLPFWLQLAGRRCRWWTERSLRRKSGFDRSIMRGIQEARLPGLPGMTVWAIEFPEDDPMQPARVATGEGLASTSRRIIAGILQEAAKRCAGKPGQPGGPMLEGLFGPAATVELFSPEVRGKPFYVVAAQGPCLALWDIVSIGRGSRGAFLLLMPVPFEDPTLPLRLTLKNWRRLVGKASGVPVFLPLPRNPGPNQGRLASLPTASGRRACRALRHWVDRVAIRPGEALEFDKLSQALAEAGGSESRRLGRRLGGTVDLGGFASDRVEHLPKAGLRARVFPLSPLTRCFGILVGGNPPAPALWQRRACVAWGSTIALILGFTWILRSFGGSLALGGIRGEMLIWALALAAIPLTLSLIAALRYQADLMTNLTEECRQELLSAFRSLEYDSERLHDRYQQAIQKAARRPGLLKDLEAIGADPGRETEFMDQLRTSCQKNGADPIGLMVIGQGDFSFSWYKDSVSSKRRNMLGLLLETTVRPFFREGATARPSSEPSKRGNRPQRPTSPLLAQLISTMVEENQFNRWNQTDRRSRLSAGGRTTICSHAILYEGKTPKYVLVLAWEDEQVARRFLHAEIPRRARKPISALAAFHASTLSLARAGGDSRLREPLRNLARRAKESQVLVSYEQELMVAAPSQKMPGFILAAAMSRQALLTRLAWEWRAAMAVLLTLLGMVAAAAWLLARWLVDPLLVMERGLRQIAGGSLDVHLEIKRSDELGEASATLDRMTEWLRERQRMSRFVAPQVLEVVAEERAESRQIQAVILVSDIRSFTTISETHSPRLVFEMLNRHLEEMTQAIQRNGGTVDRFIGDAVQAVFFDDAAQRPELRALSAAREMISAHRSLNRTRTEAGLFPYDIGIGISSGAMVAGVIGDPEHRLDFTVIGEALKDASELEAASKLGRSSRIVCASAIRQAIGQDERFHPLPGIDHGQEWQEDLEMETVFRSMERGSPNTLATRSASESARSHSVQDVPAWVFGLVFWFFPLILLNFVGGTITRSHTEQEEQKAVADIREQAGLLAQTGNSIFQVSQALSRDLQAGFHKGSRSGSVSSANLAHHLVPVLQRWKRVFPGLRYQVFRYSAPPSLDPSFFSQEGVELVAMGGRDWVPRMSPGEAELGFAARLSAVFLCAPDQVLSRFIKERLPQWLGENSLRLFQSSKRSLGMLIPEKTSFEARLGYWMPLLASDVLPLKLPDDLNFSVRGADTAALATVRGGIVLDLPPESITPERARWAIQRRMRLAGYRVTFPPAHHRQSGMLDDPPFLGKSGWVSAGGSLAGGGGEFRLFRQVKLAGAGERWKQIFHVTLLAWFAGGLCLLGLSSLDRLPKWSLSSRMIAAFSLVLLPVLALGGITLERSAVEQRARIERDLVERLDRGLRAIDRDQTLYRSQQCRLIDDFVRDQGFRMLVANELGLTPSRLTRQEISNPFFRSFPAMMAAGVRYLGKGGSLLFAWICGVNGESCIFPEDSDNKSSRVSKDMFNELFLYVLQQMQRGTRDIGGGGRRELLAGARFEEIRDLLELVFPPILFAELLQAPELSAKFVIGVVRHDFYRSYLPWRGKPGFFFNLKWGLIELLWPQILDNRNRQKAPSEAVAPSGWVGEIELLTVVDLHSPVVHAPQGVRGFGRQYGLIQLNMELGILPYPIWQMTRPAAQGRIAVNGRFSGGGPRNDGGILRIVTGDNFGDNMLVGIIRPGPMLASLQATTAAERMILAGLFLLTMMLARMVAHQLLKPILALSHAAGLIMRGDFSARLATDRADELGRLSLSFNAMAKGVEEGERLSRFVSESVREAVRDEARERAALEGMACDAVVLFAGLPGFKELQAKRHPGELILDLNRHLQLLSREIREQGGEIDKFIGDRVLAVFHLARCGGREETVRKALVAAQGMCRAAGGSDAPFGRPLGVGIVYGPVLAGIMGTALVRLEYTVVGDTVNLASRLCDAAAALPRGGIVLDGGMAALSEPFGTVRRMETRKVKGKSREVEVFSFEHRGDRIFGRGTFGE